MDFTFKGLVSKNIVIYMDDLTVYSKDVNDHPQHLRQIFQNYRKWGISFNLKKCIFRFTKGKLLGHIISKEGISINTKRVEAIEKLPYLTTPKELRYFMGKINFIQKFILGYVKIVKPLNEMMKKDANIKWVNERKKAFHGIKEGASKAPILTSIDYKNSYLYSFTLENSMKGVLT